MSQLIKQITFECRFYTDSDESICVFCVKGDSEGLTWNTIEWFPKRLCTYSKSEGSENGTMQAPFWLLKMKKLIDKITITIS